MRKRIWTGFTVLLVLASCGPASEPGEDFVMSEPLAKLISQVTGGTIARDTAIQIRFNHPMVKEGLGQTLEVDPFEFTPAMTGKSQWREESLLVFTPDGLWPASTGFQGKLLLNRLGANLPPGVPDSFVFRFQTLGREIVRLDTDLDLKNASDPTTLFLRGRTAFNEPIGLEDVKRAFKLRDGETEIALEWKLLSDREFEFASATLKRLETVDKTLLFTAEGLGLPAPVEHKIPLGASARLSWHSLSREETEEGSQVILEFSDLLSENQSLDGFVTVTPEIPIVVKKSRNKIIVTGEFQHGETYVFRLEKGLKSRFGSQTADTQEKPLVMDDLKPSVAFVSAGSILTSASGQKILFRTQNLFRVHVLVTKVFENNWGGFLQENSMDNDKERRRDFYGLHRVGLVAAEDILEVGKERNKVLVHELDVSTLLKPQDKGLFVVELFFEKADMIWNFEESEDFSGDDYYSDPSSDGYLWENGRVYKALVATDIGLTWKAAARDHWIWATDIVTGTPLGGVEVQLFTYQNQSLAKGTTGSDGLVTFSVPEGEVFYAQAQRGSERSIVKSGEMQWNLSSFATGGVEVSRDGQKGYVYLDRGIYRPGDTINLAVILRDQGHSFPERLPVILKWNNPRGQEMLQLSNNQGRDGFYTFSIPTSENDPTGTYLAELSAGTLELAQSVPVETIVPNRLKVKIEAPLSRLTVKDKELNATLSSFFLFGAPAAGLESKMTVYLDHELKTFEDHRDFHFGNDAANFESQQAVLFENLPLDEKGRQTFHYRLPDIQNSPSALSLTFLAAVAEKGGREVQQSLTLPIDPFEVYAGIKLPKSDWGYYPLGQKVPAQFLAVDAQGRIKTGRDLTLRVYKNSRWWWWEYEDHADFQMRFKADTSTRLLSEKKLVSGASAIGWDFIPDSWGEYLIEAEDEGGHKSALFFKASAWGEASAESGEGLITLKTDKERYFGGETAKISLPTPGKANLLVTVEKADRILSAQWIPTAEKQTNFTLPLTKEMAPNVYVTVSLIQNHGSSLNDRPLRMYGVANLAVEDPSTRDELLVSAPKVLRPQKEFEVSVATKSGQPMAFTLAVVDEGLLDLTGFATPDPWKHFFAKERLAVRSHDLYSEVIGAVRQDIFKAFSIGGGEDGGALRAQADSGKKRFELVSLFQGPLQTDDKGRATVKFTMPSYMGSVRIMAAGTKGHRYASGELTVPVKDKIVLLPTLPRVLGPEEDFVLPVSIFATEKNIGSANIKIETEGPLRVISASAQDLILKDEGEKNISFTLKTDKTLGKALVKITAKAGSFTTSISTSLEIRASSSPEYRLFRQTIPPKGSAQFEVPSPELAGEGRVTLSVSRRQPINLAGRLSELVAFPYGCIEQTTSAVFPQLFLKQAAASTLARKAQIDENIKQGIRRMIQFQTASGGLAYWPGQEQPDPWGTNYAGHFLLEARKLGYTVPESLLEPWVKYQQAQARSVRDDLQTRTYRLYLLALAGSPAWGAMNLVRENSLKELSDVELWLLAGAYFLAGDKSTAQGLLNKAGTTTSPYDQPGPTFGSELRDRAMILELATLMGKSDLSDSLFEEMARNLNEDSWHSTQTIGFTLMAAGKYLAQFPADPTPLQGTVSWNRQTTNFSGANGQVVLELPQAFGEKVIISTNEGTRTFALLAWEGLPLRSDPKPISENLRLTVDWLDGNGKPLNVTQLKQGAEFWGRLTLGHDKTLSHLEDLAVTQILPSGWEVENLRVTGEPLPVWSQELLLDRIQYMDVRDDRVNWFLDLQEETDEAHFLIKVRAVTVGHFHLPGSAAGAMYDKSIRALTAGKQVSVTP